MPASSTSWQPSHPRRHPTCWASSQWSNTVFSTLCHEAWTSAPLSAHPYIECRCTVLNRDTYLHPPHNNLSVHLTTTTYVRRSGRITDGMRSGRTTPQDSAISSPTPVPHPGVTLPRRALVRLNLLPTGLGRFRSCLYELGMTSSATYECGAEEQTIVHVVLQCSINRPPHGQHGLTVLDHETIEWLLLEFWYDQAMVRTAESKEEESFLLATDCCAFKLTWQSE